MISAHNQNRRTYGLKVSELRNMSLDQLKLEFTKWHILALEYDRATDRAICETQKNKIQKVIQEKTNA
jgi:hypothetical protein